MLMKRGLLICKNVSKEGEAGVLCRKQAIRQEFEVIHRAKGEEGGWPLN